MNSDSFMDLERNPRIAAMKRILVEKASAGVVFPANVNVEDVCVLLFEGDTDVLVVDRNNLRPEYIEADPELAELVSDPHREPGCLLCVLVPDIDIIPHFYSRVLHTGVLTTSGYN